jgi:hypothetical protein
MKEGARGAIDLTTDTDKSIRSEHNVVDEEGKGKKEGGRGDGRTERQTDRRTGCRKTASANIRPELMKNIFPPLVFLLFFLTTR